MQITKAVIRAKAFGKPGLAGIARLEDHPLRKYWDKKYGIYRVQKKLWKAVNFR